MLTLGDNLPEELCSPSEEEEQEHERMTKREAKTHPRERIRRGDGRVSTKDEEGPSENIQ